ncbi:S46 family peptidase [Rhodothermus profundi]|uniref:Dipeptidyl-peptidase n=1 Tax=Rhodothermus profundi TaxID=633813 RepID=A0A1M6P6L3_9BACT|nr:S46 family peptidase [Rhodothermus profundi]SHK03637.1 dipeptidyl-peptidase 7. Serine peptidase. MEROPS family S46 [Rhodothermus profundi]
MNRSYWIVALSLTLAALSLQCAGPRETARLVATPPLVTEAETTAVVRVQRVGKASWIGRDTVRSGRFDTGRLWTFEAPPLDYWEATYGFRPDSAWLTHARMGALRLVFESGRCSGAFVSLYGLVVTNHHCTWESLDLIDRPGEALLEEGFYAATLSEERRLPGLYAEQLLEARDVTAQIARGLEEIRDDVARERLRNRRLERLKQQLEAEVRSRDTTLHVEIVPLYYGARYTAYIWRRYYDVRLVMTPELRVGYFGGDYDNFTYPRYSLDISFLRIYGADGQPLKSPWYFRWNREGAQPGQLVFAIGHPGATRRHMTVSQLEFERDYTLPQRLRLLRRRAQILERYLHQQPDSADIYGLRSVYFALKNTIKATEGQLQGLRDPYLLARKQAAERALRDSMMANDSLRNRYGNVFAQLEALQRSKAAAAPQTAAFQFFGTSTLLSSHILLRALFGYAHDVMRRRGAFAARLAELRREALKIRNWPDSVEVGYITARLEELRDYLGPQHPSVQRLLGDRTPAEVARDLVARTALKDSAAFARLLQEGYLQSGDASVPVIEVLGPLYFTLGQQLDQFEARERFLNARLAALRFAVYGRTVPPDGTGTLRIADGRIEGYAYNGTQAPAFTTFYGMYDRFYSFRGRSGWSLPARWLTPSEAFERATPLNLVASTDISGGSSGSALIDQELRLVGVIFDSNLEGLAGSYIYMPDRGMRAVAVDSRGVLEALRDLYGADRLVLELTAGKLVSDEAEAETLMEMN